MKQKILALAVLAALGLGEATSAMAGSTAGTVTLAGTAVVSCTITSPVVDFGAALPSGKGNQSKTFTIDVNCSNGAPWVITASNAPTAVTVGADATSNTAVIMNSAGDSYINGGAINGTGNAAAQTTTLLMKLNGPTAAGIAGAGVISASVPISVTY